MNVPVVIIEIYKGIGPETVLGRKLLWSNLSGEFLRKKNIFKYINLLPVLKHSESPARMSIALFTGIFSL